MASAYIEYLRMKQRLITADWQTPAHINTEANAPCANLHVTFHDKKHVDHVLVCLAYENSPALGLTSATCH